VITAEDIKRAKRSIWRHRGRRFAIGLNVLASLLLAGLIVVMLNYMSYRHHARWDLSWSDYYRLSDKTLGLLSPLDAEVKVIVFFQRSHELYNDVRSVLKEYEYAAAKARKLKLSIEFVDPDRDLARVRELKQKYDLKDTNLIVFESANRRRYVEVKSIVDYDYALTGRQTIKKTASGFKAEELFSSAIQSVTQSTWPVVYFLAGHGERDLDDTKPSGYSDLARVIRRDNIEVKPLLLAEQRGIPKDCSAVIVAGPDRRISDAEAGILAKYLDRNGRLFFLIDPAVTTGFEKTLETWGVNVQPEVAAGGPTLTGRELVVAEYGDHPITRNLRKIVTMFYMPRVIEPVAAPVGAPDGLADKPTVSVLASNTAQGWAEVDLTENPPRFDPGVDRVGPVSVAVAAEKGGRVGGLEVEIKPTRLVVLGDSYFVANGAMSSGVGGNVDFFMSALNWLVERETLMGIAPKAPGVLHLDMNQKQKQAAYLAIVGLPAAGVALIGLLVWFRRRR